MRNKPKIDIVGSCVSRDVFNSRFIRDYKDYVEVGETIYQTALPSLLEQEPIASIAPRDGVKDIFIQTLNEEYSGSSLQRLTDSRPDFIIFDLFADVHMGITQKMGRYVTRNHMAFQTPGDTDTYFNDRNVGAPERMRFGDDGYQQLAIKSLRALKDRLKSYLPKTELIINSARFSTVHINEDERVQEFTNVERLRSKNEYWNSLDELSISELEAQQLLHTSDLFVASPSHPWGLHPVHYVQAYYDDLWQKIRKIIEA